jgi:hypothetical protein
MQLMHSKREDTGDAWTRGQIEQIVDARRGSLLHCAASQSGP